MGRQIQSQRYGRSTPTLQTPPHHYKIELSYRRSEDKDTISGTVVDIEHDPTRSAPIVPVKFEDEQRMILASEGISISEELQTGVSTETEPDSALPLAEIPEDVPIRNVRHRPGGGGKFAHASGVSA